MDYRLASTTVHKKRKTMYLYSEEINDLIAFQPISLGIDSPRVMNLSPLIGNGDREIERIT